jgi:hypothetical protein
VTVTIIIVTVNECVTIFVIPIRVVTNFRSRGVLVVGVVNAKLAGAVPPVTVRVVAGFNTLT